MKSIFWGKESSAKQVVQDASSEIGVPLNKELFDQLVEFVGDIAFELIDEQKKKLETPSPPQGGFPPKRKYKALKERMEKLVAEAKIMISGLEKIIEKGRISDLEESEPVGEPDFYHC